MRILFVVKRSGIAGVETLLIRTVNQLISQLGAEVHILLMIKGSESEFFEMLHPSCQIYRSLCLKDLKRLRSTQIDFVYAFESLGLLWFLLLRKYLRLEKAKLSLGVYHPMEYFWEQPPRSFIQKTIAKVVLQISERNILFMNEGVLQRYRQYSQTKIVGAQILPLPIDTSRFAGVERRPEYGKFVSIGRLVDFKTYNIHALSTVKELKAKGYDVSYHVYGTGELETPMRELIEKYCLGEVVFLHGTVPYRELENVFKSAFCFIGCGTALLESSAAGVPSIVGVESVTEPLTTGFFCDSEGYNVGEFVKDLKLEPYLFFMERILNLPKDDYTLLSEKHKKRASEFEIQTYVSRFVEVLRSSDLNEIKISRVRIVVWFFNYALFKILERRGIKNTLTNRYVAQM